MTSEFKKALFISLITYLVFFYKLLNPNLLVGGNDSESFFYPSRSYLHEALTVDHRFPFWTERIFLGFPIFADPERSFLNPVNILATLVLGPFQSFKFLHLVFYLLGSLGLWGFIKKRGYNLAGYAVANIIYFFSFFHLFHQQHQSLILTTYTIPLSLYLSDSYFNLQNKKYFLILICLLAILVYFGSFQSIVLLLIANLAFVITNCSFNRINLKHIMAGAILFISLTLPPIIPAYSFYKQNAPINNTEFAQGSYTPLMLINGVYPFYFDSGPNYKGLMISEDFLIHETYFYFGISSIFLAIGGMAIKHKDKIPIYCGVLTVIFLFLGLVAFVPFLNTLNIPVISLFRYWGRSVVLLVLAIALLAGKFISQEKPQLHLSQLKRPVLFTFAYLGILEVANYGNDLTKNIILLTIHKVLPIDFNFLLYVSVFFILAFSLFLYKSDKLSWVGVKKVFLVFLFLDLLFFGKNVLNGYLENKKDIIDRHIERVGVLNQFPNKRVLPLNGSTSGNLGLYSKSWGIFGYSQLVPKNTLHLLEVAGIDNSKAWSSDVIPPNMEALGISYVLDKDTILQQRGRIIDPEVGNLKIAEGSLEATTDYPTATILETRIKADAGWKVYIDNNTAVAERDSYINIPVPAGIHKVTLKYTPTLFYYGLIIGIIGSLLSLRYLLKES